MKKLLRIIAAALLGAGLVGGVAGASSAVIDTTGANSDNTVRFDDRVEVDVDAENNTTGVVSTGQGASSGSANVSENTNAGDAESGDAMNSATTNVKVSSNNGGSSAWAAWGAPGNGSHSATIRDTGSSSENHVTYDNSYDLDVNLTNNTTVTSSTSQSASSGSANSSQNTNGGGASTGNASNSSSSTVEITSNN